MIASPLRRFVIPSLIAGLLLLVALVALASGANADSGHIPVVITDQTVTGVCPFAFYRHVLHNSEFYTLTSEPGDITVLKIEGNVDVLLTNLDTGKMVKVNFSGSATVTRGSDA